MKVVIGIKKLFIVYVIIVLFILGGVHDFSYKDLCYTDLWLSKLYDCKSMSIINHNECRISSGMENIRDYYIFGLIYYLFQLIGIQDKFLNIFSINTIKNKIYDKKNILLDKLMHQSFDLLNSNLIKNTTTILQLHAERDECYWIIQLGALKNLDKVFEIVDKLKLNNYLVYISPKNPKKGDIIRIFVGPDSSKENLESWLDDLYDLSGLFGKVVLCAGCKKKVDN